jgi:hypothetical protein
LTIKKPPIFAGLYPINGEWAFIRTRLIMPSRVSPTSFHSQP